MTTTHILVLGGLTCAGAAAIWYFIHPRIQPTDKTIPLYRPEPTVDAVQEDCIKDFLKISWQTSAQLLDSLTAAELTALEMEINWLEETFIGLVPTALLSRHLLRLREQYVASWQRIKVRTYDAPPQRPNTNTSIENY